MKLLIFGIVLAVVITVLEIWKRLVPEKSQIVKKIEIAIIILVFITTVIGLIQKAFSPSGEELIRRTVDAVIEKRTVPLEEARGAYEEIGRLNDDLASALRRVKELESKGVKEAKGVIEELRESGDLGRLLEVLKKDRDTHRNQLIERNREIATIAYLRGDISIALEAIEEILKIQPDDLDAMNRKGHIYRLQGELTQAEEIYKKVFELAENNKNDRWRAIAASNLGNIYHTCGELNKAQEMYEKALQFNTKLGERGGMVINYSNLGTVYFTRDELDKAEDIFRKALTIAEKTGDKDKMTAIYGNLGNVYIERGEIDKAEEMYDKALKAEEEGGRPENKGSCYSNLGLVYKERGELLKAERMHNKALEIAAKMGNKELIAISYNNLGGVYAARSDLRKAEEMYNKSLQIAEEMGDKEKMAINYSCLGGIYGMKGELKKARDYLVKARDLYAEIDVPSKVKEMQGWIKSITISIMLKRMYFLVFGLIAVLIVKTLINWRRKKLMTIGGET